MVKQDLVNIVAHHTGLTTQKAQEVIDTTLIHMREALQRGERIELRRFGVFSVGDRKRIIGRNPRTGQVVEVKPGKRVRFKPGKYLAKIGVPQNGGEDEVRADV